LSDFDRFAFAQHEEIIVTDQRLNPIATQNISFPYIKQLFISAKTNTLIAVHSELISFYDLRTLSLKSSVQLEKIESRCFSAVLDLICVTSAFHTVVLLDSEGTTKARWRMKFPSGGNFLGSHSLLIFQTEFKHIITSVSGTVVPKTTWSRRLAFCLFHGWTDDLR
jgi:hypothetical protein